MSYTDQFNEPKPAAPARGRKAVLPLVAAGMLALGGVAGATLMAHARPSAVMAPATPVAIRSLTSSGIVTIAGRVAEIYGNKFVMADASGRALVDTGHEGEDGRLVTMGEPVTIQGRFDHGFLHAAFLVGPDKKVTSLSPIDRPPHGHGRGPQRFDSSGHDDGARGPDGDDMPPMGSANLPVGQRPITPAAPTGGTSR